MASSLYIQTTMGDKRKAGPVCKRCKNPGGPFGIMGEYVHGKWKNVGYFCVNPICAFESVQENIRPGAFNKDTAIKVRMTYGGKEADTLVKALTDLAAQDYAVFK